MKDYIFKPNISNKPINIEKDTGPTQYNKRMKSIANMYAGFIKEDLEELGVSRDEANKAANSFRESILNPPDEEEDYNNDPISAPNTTIMDETDKTPVILDPGMKSILEQQLGHPITTLGHMAECWNKGIIQPLDPKIVRELMDASANWDCDDDDDDDWIM